MKILITGNMGYVGPAVVSHLRREMPDCLLVGVDTGLFAHCLTQANLPERLLNSQVFADVRDLPAELFEGVDAVVHLAAVSNDPMGGRFEAVTDEINHRATLRTAELAARMGVRSFVFASSCSMYGFAEGGARTEADELNPLTAYSRSKVAAETGLGEIARNSQMRVSALRFATACGFSGRTRLDLVLNDFVASALRTGRVSVLSDGTPWRPLIHVNDMARAIEWALLRQDGGNFLAVNVGSEDWNYQVRELAEAVAASVPGTVVEINKDAPPDRRSYRVNFDLYRSLAPAHQPEVTLAGAIADLKTGLDAAGLKDPDYRSAQLVRLNVLTQAIDGGSLGTDLRYTANPSDRSFIPGFKDPAHRTREAMPG
ncbi:NAD-dependent epimerase/dehydratase family protein [Rhizobium gallicum]|uniref:NAD-dependent epimerase/dehydratase family protein n=1 Tax=Rhizobium gallicum TaxID=56730 RepID=UPI001EF80ED8|nr:NAD(P)-dependent oxidoreductase [Rhizobium gallicum]ULJ74867.1 NAD(P)-dependent oxidoreductase [Rhizobium gallicum]